MIQPSGSNRGQIVRNDKRIKPGIIDRKAGGDAGTIRARLSRQDAAGRVQREDQSWAYIDAASRRDAIEAAERWRLDVRVAIRRDPVLEAAAAARRIGKTLKQWLVDYADELGYRIRELADGQLARSKDRHATNSAGVPLRTERTDLGARSEVGHILGWITGWAPGAPDLAAMQVDEITSDHIQAAIQAEIDEGEVSNSTIRIRLAALVAVAKFAEAHWKEKALLSALRGATWPKADGLKPGRYISLPEWAAIIAEVGDTELLTLSAIRFLRWTGGRRSEAGRIDWADITEDDTLDGPVWQLHFRNTKTPKKDARSQLKSAMGRKIPIIDATWEALLVAAKIKHPQIADVAELQAVLRQDQGQVTRTLAGRIYAGLALDSISQAWARMTERAKVDARLHDLRHTRTTEYVRATGSLLEAARLSGHSDVDMLRRYHHEDAATLRDRLDRADERASPAEQARKEAARQAEAASAIPRPRVRKKGRAK